MDDDRQAGDPPHAEPNIASIADRRTLREARERREREALLRNAVTQRARNIIAVTRSIFCRTIENAESPEAAIEHFPGRLAALARYQGRSDDPTQRSDLAIMVEDELLACASNHDTRVEVTGPDIDLPLRVAEPFGLALHELATNSVKFGVLSEGSARARLRISWRCEPEMLHFEWRESGLTSAANPARSGFGRYFIEEALPYQLGAEARFGFAEGEFRCTIRLPLSLIEQTGGES